MAAAMMTAAVAPALAGPTVVGAKATQANRFLGISLNARRTAQPIRASKRTVVAQMKTSEESLAHKASVGATTLAASVAATMACSGDAMAAQEVVGELAKGVDGRLGAIALLFVPAIGWVGFNILKPGLNQFGDMQQQAKKKSKKAVAAGLGLSAAAMMAMPEQAHAAQEVVGELAKGVDGRLGAIAALFVPAIGWVGFNILKPGLNQFGEMQQQAKSKKATVAGLGLSAAAMMAMPEQAHAAQEVVGELAKGVDGRVGAIAALFVPAVGWVGFNILKPGLNQFGEMQQQAKSKKATVAGLGLSAAAMMAMPEQAHAAQEVVGELAKGVDGRLGAIAALFVPAIGWVGFNILKPGLNQFGDMQQEAKKKSKKAVAAGLGLSAAAMMAMPEQAYAAQEVVGELAKGVDGRLGAIAALFVPAIGWVGFNILKPGLNQFGDMQQQAKKKSKK